MFWIRASNFQNITKLFQPSFKIHPIRSFYADQELGVDDIKRMRQQILDRFEKRNDVNIHKNNLVKNFRISSIKDQRNHLKELILLLNEKRDDLNSLKSILVQYPKAATTDNNSTKTSNHRQHSEFCFGTAIMKMFHLLDHPDGAIEVINSIEIS